MFVQSMRCENNTKRAATKRAAVVKRAATGGTRRRLSKRGPSEERVERIIMGAIGPYQDNCAAFGNPAGPATPNYINVCKLGIGKIKLDSKSDAWDEVTKGILSYDRAETNGAYLGQLNVVAASSFIGPHGALWGYEVADNTRNEKPMYSVEGVPVYSIDPLLAAGEALLGTNQESTSYYGQTRDTPAVGARFSVLPGEIQPCAVKSAKHRGAGVIWSAMGIGFPKKDLIEKVAKLFYEDAGFFPSSMPPTEAFIRECEDKLTSKMKDIAKAMILNGKDQILPIDYSRIFIGFKMLPINHDEYGTAITLSPYITLARNAVPKDPRSLARITLREWEKAVDVRS